jgi:hypothetical protein
VVEQAHSAFPVVEGTCPRCGTHIGPLPVPRALWENLPDRDSYQYDLMGAITTDELIDFAAGLSDWNGLSPPRATGPDLLDRLEFARAVAQDGADHDLCADVWARVRAAWPLDEAEIFWQETGAAYVREIEREIDAAIHHRGRGWLAALTGAGLPPSAARYLREHLRQRLESMAALGLLMGLALHGELDDLVRRWREKKDRGG